MYFNRGNKQTNVVNISSVADVDRQLKEKGTVVHIADAYDPVSVKEAASDPTHPARQVLANHVLSGNIELSAPFPGMEEPWTEEKIKEFEAICRRS